MKPKVLEPTKELGGIWGIYMSEREGQNIGLIRSVWRASKFWVLKLIEIVILLVYYTIPFGFSLCWHFRVNIFYIYYHFVWRGIADEGSLPEMRIWTIVLIKPELNWCIHLSRSLFLYLNIDSQKYHDAKKMANYFRKFLQLLFQNL